MNKTTIVILFILIFTVATYLYFLDDDTAPTATETDTTTLTGDSDYVGMTVTEAMTKAEAGGTMFRLVEIDGEPQLTTSDFREGLINATVVGDVVTSYTVESNNPASEELQADATPGSIPNPMFNENLLAGDMIDLQNLSDEDAEANIHDAIIGRTEAEAMAYAETNNVSFRVTKRDDEYLAATMDYRPGRISAAIENDIVVSYTTE